MRINSVLSAAIVALGLAGSASAQLIYAPTQNPPELINGVPWNWNYTVIGAATPVQGTAGTIVNTIPGTNGTYAGFNISNGGSFNNALMPVLSAGSGYTVRFQVGVTAEQHVDRNGNSNFGDDDRAGFSLIAVSSDNSKAIELGFFTDRIFSQNSNFVGQGETVAVSTIPLTTYDLTILGNGYTLKSGATTLLSGNLRQYNQNGVGHESTDLLYSTTNWIFMGDDTTSAAGSFEIARVEILPVPEASTVGVLGLGTGILLRRKRSKT